MKRLENVKDQLPVDEHCRFVSDDKMEYYEVLGKKFQMTMPFQEFKRAIQKMYDGYGHRAKMAEQNQGIDWKAVSHALRAAYQLHEIYTEGDITFPLRKREWLLKVKSGQADYTTEVAPCLEEIVHEVQALAESSSFPEKIDVGVWEDWLMDVYSNFLIE